jgi:hypothetical protein
LTTWLLQEKNEDAMVDITKFLESERKAHERDPERYKKERAEDARREYKDFERYSDPKLMERYERMKARKGSGGGSGGAGVSDTREMQLGSDLDPKAMMKKEGYKKGGSVKSASARADGCCVRGKTRA